MYVDNCEHEFDQEKVKVFDKGNIRKTRGFLKAWHFNQASSADKSKLAKSISQ